MGLLYLYYLLTVTELNHLLDHSSLTSPVLSLKVFLGWLSYMTGKLCLIENLFCPYSMDFNSLTF